MIATVSEQLTNAKWLPHRSRCLGGPLNTLLFVHLRRMWLRARAKRILNYGPDDVTVVIGTRNRSDYRLRNSLASLRAQDYRCGMIRVIVVDYGSDNCHAQELKRLCHDSQADYLRCEVSTGWNRSHCLNIGIRSANTKFIMTADTDIVFAQNYVRTAVNQLRKNPIAAIYSVCLDLQQETSQLMHDLSADALKEKYSDLVKAATPRFSDEDCHGILITLLEFVKMVRGYDEYFRVWGGEDDDLERRLRYLGLIHQSLSEDSTYLHQWHPQHEGVAGQSLHDSIQRNRNYLSRTHSILRNDEHWGTVVSVAR